MTSSVDYFKLFPENYKWVWLGVTTLNIECFLLGLIYVNYIRTKIFSQDFMNNNFGDTHQACFKSQPPKGGYADAGNGKYSERLSLKNWFDFNVGYRGHINFTEGLPFTVIIGLLAGLFYPITAAIFLGISVVARLIFIIGYVIAPRLRSIGFLPAFISQFVLTIIFLVGFFRQLF